MDEIVREISLKLQSGEFSFLFVFAAFLGGVIASLTPCSLGVLPIILGYVAGYGETQNEGKFSANLKTFLQLSSFVLGLSIVLTVIGVICALTGRVFASIGAGYWIIIIASLVLVMGLNLIGVLDLPMPVIVKKMPKSEGTSLFLYPLLIGMLFALAATPCSTPILAGIMGFAALTKNLLYAALLLFMFALGQGLIIILIGVSASFLKNMKRFSSFSEILLKAAGVVLILSSIFLYWKVFSRFIG